MNPIRSQIFSLVGLLLLVLLPVIAFQNCDGHDGLPSGIANNSSASCTQPGLTSAQCKALNSVTSQYPLDVSAPAGQDVYLDSDIPDNVDLNLVTLQWYKGDQFSSTPVGDGKPILYLPTISASQVGTYFLRVTLKGKSASKDSRRAYVGLATQVLGVEQVLPSSQPKLVSATLKIFNVLGVNSDGSYICSPTSFTSTDFSASAVALLNGGSTPFSVDVGGCGRHYDIILDLQSSENLAGVALGGTSSGCMEESGTTYWSSACTHTHNDNGFGYAVSDTLTEAGFAQGILGTKSILNDCQVLDNGCNIQFHPKAGRYLRVSAHSLCNGCVNSDVVTSLQIRAYK